MSGRLPRESALDADGDDALADVDSTSHSAFRPFTSFDSGSSIFNLNPPNLRSEPRGSGIEPPILSPATLFCRYCQKSGWSGPQELLNHTKEAHDILKKAFPCFDCRLAGFSRKRRLTMHQISGECLGPSWELLYQRTMNYNQTATACGPHSLNGMLTNSDSGERNALRSLKMEKISRNSSTAQVKQPRGSNVQKGTTGHNSLSHLFPGAENRDHFVDGVDRQMSERSFNGHALSMHVPSATDNTTESANFSRKRHCSDSYTRDLLPRHKVLKADPELAVSQGTGEKCQSSDVPANKNHVHQKTTVLKDEYASQSKPRTTHPSCRRSLLDWESFISSSNSTKRPLLPKQNDGNAMNEPPTDPTNVRRTKLLPRSRHHTDDSVTTVSSSNKLSTAHGKNFADTSLSTSNDSQSSAATRTVLEIENRNSSNSSSHVSPSKENSNLSDKKESLQLSLNKNKKDLTKDASCSKAKRLRTEGKSSRLPTSSSNRARTECVTEGKSASPTDSETPGTKGTPLTIQTSTQRPSDALTISKVDASSDVDNGGAHISVGDVPKESNASPMNSPKCDSSLRTASPGTISTDEVCTRSGEADLFGSKSPEESHLALNPPEKTQHFPSASSLSSISDDIIGHSSCDLDVEESHCDNPNACLSFEESQTSRAPISVNFKEFIQIVREGATKRRSIDKVTAVNAQGEADSKLVKTEKEELVPIHFQPFEDIDQEAVSKRSLSESSDSVGPTSPDTVKEISESLPTYRQSKRSHRRTRNISKKTCEDLSDSQSFSNNQSGILPIPSTTSEFGSNADRSNSLTEQDLPSSASNTVIEGIVISRSVLHPRKSIVSSSTSCCPYCARVCIDPRSLERHLRVCKSKPVDIPVQSFCAETVNKSDAGSATLTGSGAILRKLASKDEIKSSFRERIPCPRCSLLFTGPTFLERHLQMCRGHGEKLSEPQSPSKLHSESLLSPEVASADTGSVICPNCSARFLRFRYMRKHLLKCMIGRQKNAVKPEEGLNSSITNQNVVTESSDDPVSPLSRVEQYKTFTCPHCARKFWKESNMLSHAKRCKAGPRNSLSSPVDKLPIRPDSVSSSREQKDNSEEIPVEPESNAVDTNTAVSDRHSPIVATLDSGQDITEQMSADKKSSDDKNTDESLLDSKPAAVTPNAAQTIGFKSPKKTTSTVCEQSTPAERGRKSKITNLVRAGKVNANPLILRSRLRSHSSTPLSRRRSVLSVRNIKRPSRVKYLCSPDLRSPGLRLRIRKSSLENPSKRFRSRSVSSRSSDTASSATIAARIREQKSSRRRSSVNSLEDTQSTVSDATTAPAISESVCPPVARQQDSVNKPIKCRYCHRTGFRSARLCSVHERNCSRKIIVGRRRHTTPGNSVPEKNDVFIKMWPCEQCGSVFRIRSELRAHRETCCGRTISSMSCPGCPKNAPAFPTTEALLTHLLTLKAGPGHPYANHGSLATAAVWPSFLNVPNLGFGCHICGLLLASETRLDKHKRAVHEAWLQDEQEKAISPQKNG